MIDTDVLIWYLRGDKNAYNLSHSMELVDAMIAATASIYGMILITANDKHYRVVKELSVDVFRSSKK